MAKRSTSEILEVATTVARALESNNPSKKAKKTKKNNFFINHKEEFMLTWANTYDKLTKEMVEQMLAGKDKVEKFIISIEKCHSTDDHEHIHAYVKMTEKFSTRDHRCFDVYSSLFDNETHSNHPNIKYKGDTIFGKAKKGDKATYDMMKYVIKEDKEPISNFDYQTWMDSFVALGEKDTRRVIIPFYEWIHEKKMPLQEEVYRRIKNNPEWYQNYIDYFLQINSLIKQDFPTEIEMELEPNWDLMFYIPKPIQDWINGFEDWWKKPYDRPKGLWITGCTRSAKTSLIACLGPNNYFPNVWNFDNFTPGKKFNFFDDQDLVFESMEDFRYFKGFCGGQKMITISGKYKKPKTVVNNIPCIWCSNMRFEDQVKDIATRNFIKENMVIVELGNYDLKKVNYPPRTTINGMYWTDFDPKCTYYYYLKMIEKTTDWDKYNYKEEEHQSVVVEPPTSPIQEINDDDTIDLLESDGSSE